MTASVSEAEYNLDLPAASATASAQVVESPGMIQFGDGTRRGDRPVREWP